MPLFFNEATLDTTKSVKQDVAIEKRRQLQDETKKIQAQEEIVKQKKKQLSADASKIKTESEEDVQMNPKIDEKLLKESLRIIEEEARNIGIFMEDEDFLALTEGSNFGKTGRKNIVRLNREGRMSWLKSRAAIAYARAANDRLYTQLQKTSRKRKKLIAQINQKYASKSTIRAKELIVRNSKSNDSGANIN